MNPFEAPHPKMDIHLAFWISERYAIKMRRDEGMKPPWSNDYAMATTRFCNVHREDDKVTRWIAENWRDANKRSPNLTLAMTLARLINFPDTLEIIGFPYAFTEGYREAVKNVMRKRAAQGHKVWSSAYIVSTCGRKMAKEDYVLDHVCAQVAEVPWDFTGRTLAEAYEMLLSVDGLGSFLAAQVIADLKNTPGHALQTAEDWHTWAVHGPGSLRGLNYFFTGEPEGPVRPNNFQKALKACYDHVKDLIPGYVPAIHMQDFQNCMCEFSKYIRVTQGDGRARNRYRPG